MGQNDGAGGEEVSGALVTAGGKKLDAVDRFLEVAHEHGADLELEAEVELEIRGASQETRQTFMGSELTVDELDAIAETHLTPYEYQFMRAVFTTEYGIRQHQLLDFLRDAGFQTTERAKPLYIKNALIPIVMAKMFTKLGKIGISREDVCRAYCGLTATRTEAKIASLMEARSEMVQVKAAELGAILLGRYQKGGGVTINNRNIQANQVSLGLKEMFETSQIPNTIDVDPPAVEPEDQESTDTE